MGRLIDSFKAYITDDADALAGDIVLGKTAYIGSGKVTGTYDPLPQQSYPAVSRRVQAYIEFPNGAGVYPWSVTDSDFAILNPALTAVTTSDCELGSGGVIFLNSGASNSFNQLLNVTGMPALTTTTRIFEMNGKVSGTMAGEDGIRLLVNYGDSDNYWEARLYWYASSVAPRVYLIERVGGVNNFRGSPANLSGVSAITTTDNPQWWLRVIDEGDKITFQAGMNGNSGDLTDTVSVSASTAYHLASRPLKSNQDFSIAGGGGSLGRFRVANLIVTDRVY